MEKHNRLLRHVQAALDKGNSISSLRPFVHLYGQAQFGECMKS